MSILNHVRKQRSPLFIRLAPEALALKIVKNYCFPGPPSLGRFKKRTVEAACAPGPQPVLVFRPAGIFTIAAGAAEITPWNRFSPTPWGGFCTPQAGSSFTASTDMVSAMQVENAYED